MMKLKRAEHVGWFGAGLSTAAVGVVAFQLVLGAPQPLNVPLSTRTPYPTRTPFPTHTPYPTRTPRPFPSPTPVRVAPDLLATLTIADPERVVSAVATFASRTSRALATSTTR